MHSPQHSCMNMLQYDLLHPLNDLFPSGEVCQDWLFAMHYHMSTVLNISAQLLEKCCKNISVDFRKSSLNHQSHHIFISVFHLQWHRLNMIVCAAKRLKVFFVCVCVCHLCDLFAVVLEALFRSYAPGCGLWCCWLLKRGWFSTGDRCSVT